MPNFPETGAILPKEKIPTYTWGQPSFYAICRNMAGRDMAAGLLLYRLVFRWKMDKKLLRLGKEWVAMSRADWASEAGLSNAEMINRALPKLRKCGVVSARGMVLKGKKLLWMNLDVDGFNEHLPDGEAMSIFNDLLNGAKYPGYETSKVNYPYKEPLPF
jgi:hypothetical protein